jgi:hypothetical protein
MTIVAPWGGGCRCSGAIREGVIMADEASRESQNEALLGHKALSQS